MQRIIVSIVLRTDLNDDISEAFFGLLHFFSDLDYLFHAPLSDECLVRALSKKVREGASQVQP